MRIVVADYSGHPFQVHLSRELARRGHAVLHLHFAEFQTPKGRLTVDTSDSKTLSIEPISLGNPFAKQSFIRRRFQEVAIGHLFANRISKFKADVVLASNLPLDSLHVVFKRARAEGTAFVFWQQDIYSIAIDRIMRRWLGPIGSLIGSFYKAIEKSVLRNSQAVVAITEDFVPHLCGEFGVEAHRIYVLENWAPLDEIAPRQKDNPWARANGLVHKDVILYTGTLGLKHDPAQILAVAAAVNDRRNSEVVVVSEGPAADWLARMARKANIGSLRVVGFQPFEVYPDVLGSADILLSILEPDAGQFSVPSKVLSYLCAGRAIVLSAPTHNLASRIVRAAAAGQTAPAGDKAKLVNAVFELLDDSRARAEAAQNARAYAERTFRLESIADRFESILVTAARDR